MLLVNSVIHQVQMGRSMVVRVRDEGIGMQCLISNMVICGMLMWIYNLGKDHWNISQSQHINFPSRCFQRFLYRRVRKLCRQLSENNL